VLNLSLPSLKVGLVSTEPSPVAAALGSNTVQLARFRTRENLAMPTQLKYVDPNRRPSSFSRAYAAFSNTRLGRFLSVHVVWKVDPYLMRVTRGRVGFDLTIPTALLETRGAKSGAMRRNVVIYFHDGDRVTIVASKLGYEKHPAWFHNLRVNPDVKLGGIPMRATVVADEVERSRLWALADRVFAPYAAYRREAAKASREIPIVQLTAGNSDA
jgi:deazaflavin-dependent oxidoreductase (nitroreductase family)